MGEVREVSISLDGVRDKNLMQLKKLNTALFPVRYNEKYYADVLASGEFTKLGLILLPSTSLCFIFFIFSVLLVCSLWLLCFYLRAFLSCSLSFCLVCFAACDSADKRFGFSCLLFRKSEECSWGFCYELCGFSSTIWWFLES